MSRPKNLLIETYRGTIDVTQLVRTDIMRAARLRLNLTQFQVAERAGLPKYRYHDIEGGRRPDLCISTIARVAVALEMSIDQLVRLPGRTEEADRELLRMNAQREKVEAAIAAGTAYPTVTAAGRAHGVTRQAVEQWARKKSWPIKKGEPLDKAKIDAFAANYRRGKRPKSNPPAVGEGDPDQMTIDDMLHPAGEQSRQAAPLARSGV